MTNKLSDIVENWFSLNNTDLSQELLLTQGYVLLDMHPLFNEKLKKQKSTWIILREIEITVFTLLKQSIMFQRMRQLGRKQRFYIKYIIKKQR